MKGKSRSVKYREHRRDLAQKERKNKKGEFRSERQATIHQN